MSRIALKANASGSGVFTVESPNSDTDRTLNLPDKSGTVHVGEGIVDNADATAITINSSEQVGIGTANPSDKLHVYGGASGASAHSYTQLHVEHSSHAAIQLSSPNTTESAIFFSDPQSNSAGGVGYYHAEDFMYLRANGATRLRVDSDGIKFAADTASANALDDYEEGTYTAEYKGSANAGSTTYSRSTGVYTKIGRTVTVWVDMTITAQSGATGHATITLPFTSGNNYGTDAHGNTRFDMGGFIPWAIADNFTNTKQGTGWITNNSAYMTMYYWNTGGHGSLSGWSLNTTGRISGKIIYTAA